MATKDNKPKSKKDKDAPNVLMVDTDLNLFNLTDLGIGYYNYHENSLSTSFTNAYYSPTNRHIVEKQTPVSKNRALRLIEAMRLGSRPFPGGAGIDIDKPNPSFGYMRQNLQYVSLPYKAVLAEKRYAKIQVDRTLFEEEKLTKAEKEKASIEQGGEGNAPANSEISSAVSNVFNTLLSMSNDMKRAHAQMSTRIQQDGYIAFLHSDLDWRVTPVHAIDLITEPQASTDPDTWASFFVIRRMSAAQIIEKIQKPSAYWNAEALRWALEAGNNSTAMIGSGHSKALYADDQEMQDENFSIRSYYQDKAARLNNVSSYYGNLFVMEGYYRNMEGTINKVIFFPSTSFHDISRQDRENRLTMTKAELKKAGLDGADVLFKRENIFQRMSEAITPIVYDESEPVLERQRATGHEIFSLCENIMRLDSAIMQGAILMGTPFFKDVNDGQDASNPEDLEFAEGGEPTNLGSREFIETPFQINLQAMSGIRSLYLSHLNAKGFLGGLENAEAAGEGRGGSMVEMRLVKDGRIHKHIVNEFNAGRQRLYSKQLKKMLDMCENDTLLNRDPLLKYKFHHQLTKVYGYSEDFLKFKKDEVLPDTYLPYWLNIEAMSNTAGSFGPAEVVLYREAKNLAGDALDQRGAKNLARATMTSMLGTQETIDILGDPKSNKVTDDEQKRQAELETAAILGSVTANSMDYVAVSVLMSQDDHVVHLTASHNLKASEIIKVLQEVDFTPQALAEAAPHELTGRSDQILKLSALAAHISQHQQGLERFGHSRSDVNKLKEETNNILQTAEALLKNLELNQRALVSKQQDERARLQNLSPENEAEKAKNELKLKELSIKEGEGREKLALANKLSADAQSRHMDTQLTKARDRQAKIDIAKITADSKRQADHQSNAVKLIDTQTKEKIARTTANSRLNGSS